MSEGHQTPVWPVKEITDYLLKVARVEGGARSFATFTLEHASEWRSQPLPGICRRGLPKQCFGNSQRILFSEFGKKNGFVYVEGYACPGNLSFPFPVAHAWLVDQNGGVVDPTWEDSAISTYFGVAFDPEYVFETVTSAGVWCSMLDNFHDRWSLVRDPNLASKAVMNFDCQERVMVRP